MYETTRYLAAGDHALVMEFGNEITDAINQKIRAMSLAIEQDQLPGISELVPTYRSMMIHYDPLVISGKELTQQLQRLEQQLAGIQLPPPQVTVIPTLYGGDYGPDLATVAGHNQLTEAAVIEKHTSREYLIYMLGFTPGFPYLGGMDPAIATPRLATPRTKIRGGSVGIAGSQTGIYSIDSPGGWQLIGWTPVPLYDPQAATPILLKAGNYVKFEAITEADYEAMKPRLESRTYTCREYPYPSGGAAHA